ncbi:MAG TPA: endopeptidase La [Candidatus Binatia bacterium]|jgi:ATP-dependent Lon protease
MRTLEGNAPEAKSPAAPTSESEFVLPPLPTDAIIVVPLRNAVLFPAAISPIAVGRTSSIAAVREAARLGSRVAFVLQRDPARGEVTGSDLYAVGTVGQIVRMAPAGDKGLHLLVHGQERARLVEYLAGWPFLVARVEIPAVEEAIPSAGPEVEARFLQLKEQATEALRLLPNVPDEYTEAVQSIDGPGPLCDTVANLLDIPNTEKQDVLETFDLRPRLDKVLELLGARVQVLRLSKDIGDKARKEFDERQREHVLREQLRQIHKELGDENLSDVEELGTRLDEAGMPEETLKQTKKEYQRLTRMGEASPESSMVRTYLELMAELPWKLEEESPIDIAAARRILDEDHYGLDKIKRRILEFLAVRKLNPGGKSPILCFVGPPGVGKTSLGHSIARATGRPFQRVALGGTHDEAEIRGHRRTYIGSMPGNVIQAIRRAGSRRAVLMLDEIDKLGAGGFHGDPASAMLEVLDPEQNVKFRDNYLGVDFDLSHMMFIATANSLDTIPGPLQDRMEIISLPGYTEDEKLEIASRYLVRRQLEANGLTPEQAQVTRDALRSITREYTREAGVRNLEREIGSVLRSAAMSIAEGTLASVSIDSPQVPVILGAPKFENETALRTAVPGVATGLAWTPFGGDILFIEASKTPGSGKLILTGQLGDVMKESAQAAVTLAKGVVGDSLEKIDLHIHVPAGATPKDGPSAGVAIFVALVSLLTDRPVRPDLAMTGEISLRGLVLPIGGVKEKLLAALRAGITTVMLPRRNQKDLEDVPANAKERLEVIWMDRVEDAVWHALDETTGRRAVA